MQDKLAKPILILGAGKNGSVFLEEFIREPEIEVAGIYDKDAQAPGMQLARHYGIPTFSDVHEALDACKDSMVFNLTGHDEVSELAADIVGAAAVLGGEETFTIWKLVNRLKKTHEELSRSQAYFNAVVNYAHDGIVTIDTSGTIIAANPSAHHLFGYNNGELVGERVNRMMPSEYAAEHDNHIRRYLETGVSKLIGVPRELPGIRKDGSEFPIDLSLSVMQVHDTTYFIGIIRDATERVEYLERVHKLALYDHLTGLPNRIMFYDRLEQALLHGKRYKVNFALLFLDLDGFKTVNDHEGHDAGDGVLTTVAKLLQGCVRESDTLARMGGDEFVAILPTLSKEDDLIRLIRKMNTALTGHPFSFGGRSYTIGASIGAARFPLDSDDSDMLVKKADDAMYVAKKANKRAEKEHFLCLVDKLVPLEQD
ncbi:MAG TPA: diguanylate cyclase [Mariprofundaceae bacterium]|nr:diguanylate cyclase [Mariprofundaceae bacterium]